MPPNDLRDWDLAVAVAKAAGRKLRRSRRFDGSFVELPPPAYHESLNACFRDLVPELAARKWRVRLEKEDREGGEYRAEFANTNEQTGGHVLSAYDPNPATALARCYLAVKEHEAGQSEERAPWARASVEGWL